MKQEKFDDLYKEVEQFMADRYFKSFHRIFFEHIVEAFPDVKKKHLKKVWKDLKQ